MASKSEQDAQTKIKEFERNYQNKFKILTELINRRANLVPDDHLRYLIELREQVKIQLIRGVPPEAATLTITKSRVGFFKPLHGKQQKLIERIKGDQNKFQKGNKKESIFTIQKKAETTALDEAKTSKSPAGIQPRRR